jgi:histidine triad (HIT) family protein
MCKRQTESSSLKSWKFPDRPMSTIFSKIIAGEIPAFKVAENDEFLAFLDINPLRMGHTLVIPKQEIDYFFDIASDDMAKMLVFTAEVAKAIKVAYPCKKVGMTVIGLEVPHAHIHLVPMDGISDMNFSGPKLNPSMEELREAVTLIQAAIGAK